MKIRNLKLFFDSWQLLWLKIRGAKLGKNVLAYGRFNWEGYPHLLKIGNNVSINEGVFINCRGGILIGNNCHLSPGCQLQTGYLEFDAKVKKKIHKSKKIFIGDNCWVASNAIVIGGVNMADNSVLAAGGVLNSNTEQGEMWAGVPARVKKKHG